MQPAPHPSATRRIGAPRDWNAEKHGPCATIEVADVVQDGLGYMETIWRPDAEELAALNAGAGIVLGINGFDHPVIYLSVTVPPQHEAEVPRR